MGFSNFETKPHQRPVSRQFLCHFRLYRVSSRQLENHFNTLKMVMLHQESRNAESMERARVEARAESAMAKAEATDTAAECLISNPGEVLETVTKRGIPWTKVMDNVCSWSTLASTTLFCSFLGLFIILPDNLSAT